MACHDNCATSTPSHCDQGLGEKRGGVGRAWGWGDETRWAVENKAEGLRWGRICEWLPTTGGGGFQGRGLMKGLADSCDQMWPGRNVKEEMKHIKWALAQTWY